MLVYSTSKGLSAMTLALAHSRGWLDYDERVTTYWPEFGQAGKEAGHGPPAARPRGRPARDRRAARHQRCSPTSTGWRRPSPASGRLAAGHAPRLPRGQPRLVRGRADPARRPRSGARWGASSPRRSPRRSGSTSTSACRTTWRPERLARIERVPPLKALPQLRHLPRRDGRGDAQPALAQLPGLRQPAPALPGGPRPRASTGGSSSPRAEPWAARATSPAPTRRSRRPRRARPDARHARGARRASLARRRSGWHDEVLKVDTAFSLGFARPLGPFRFGSSERAFGHPGRGRLVRLRRPRPRRGLRLRDEPARLPPQRRPAREGAARRALPLPLIRAETRCQIRSFPRWRGSRGGVGCARGARHGRPPDAAGRRIPGARGR